MAKKNRRSHKELFMDKLKELSGEEQKLIGNKTLREALEWDESRYQRIKSQLKDDNQIISGTGKGGSVGLASAPGSKALSIFVSYSHADEKLKIDLLKHLEPLKKLNLIDTWHDRKITPGQAISSEISKNLESADIILLLVSIDFLNSIYCCEVEMERALERQAEGSCTVIPVILRNCLWKKTEFADLLALPKDGKAVASWTDKDDAFTEVAEGIKNVAEKMMELK